MRKGLPFRLSDYLELVDGGGRIIRDETEETGHPQMKKLNVNFTHLRPDILYSLQSHFPLLCNQRNRKHTHERRTVMKDTIIIPMLVIITAFLSRPVTVSAADSWQEKMLFNPTPAQLETEQTRARIMIYHGLKDVQVGLAMDEQFDRIEHMMFTGTVVTNSQGEVLIDEETGETKVEDDDC